MQSSEPFELEVPVSIGERKLDPVKLLVNPSTNPGSPTFVFAVYARNPAYMKLSRDERDIAFKVAIETWAAMENRTVDIRPEHLRPLNMMGESK